MGEKEGVLMERILRETTCGVDWAEAAELVERAPLGRRDPQALRRAFEASAHVCFVYEGKRLLGLGRALSAGVWQGGIYDICVLPEAQGTGVGNLVVSSLLARMEGLTVILFASPGKEPFYEKLGFRRMRTGMGRFACYEQRREQGYVD